jgi:hypothetical protein
MASIEEIYRKSISDRKTEYEAVGISRVKIDNNEYTNYAQFQFIWEKTYVKSPKRSGSGSMGNLNSYATFVTPHLQMNFALMSIDDYRRIMRQHYERNEFTVECYDPIYNDTIVAKMYFATEQMAKLHTIANMRLKNDGSWEEWVDLVAVEDYTVELIGTNNDLDLVSVIYHLNPPTDTGEGDSTEGEEDVYKGEEIVIGSGSTFKDETFGGAYSFDKWTTNPDGSGNVYVDGNAYTINSNIVLYAQWQKTTAHTLTYNYGLADPAINESANTYITSINVVQGESIGALPVVETPTVTINEKVYRPYYNGAWYKTPVKATNSVAVTNNELYWSDRDSSIYLIYDVMTYPITYYVDGKLRFTESGIQYNNILPLPQLVKENHTFDGWYTTADYQDGTKISGNMPPYALTLYGRFIAN